MRVFFAAFFHFGAITLFFSAAVHKIPLTKGFAKEEMDMPNCGVVDVGSNTVRLSIYRYENGGFKLLLGKKETVGLAGYVKNGVLSPAGIQEACQVIAQFQNLLRNLGVEELHIFATASLRNIVNTDEALSAIWGATGAEIEVISGAEEAALSYLGALWGAPETADPGLLSDIGGGSTELVVCEDGNIRSAVSLPLGSLSLFTQYVEGIFPTAGEAKIIRRHVADALSRVEATPCTHLRGVGGTIRAAGKLCGLKPGQALAAQDIRALCRRLKKGDSETLRDVLRISPDRIHTLLPGLIILREIVKTFSVETVDVSLQGVREGYLLSRVLGKEAPYVQGE